MLALSPNSTVHCLCCGVVCLAATWTSWQAVDYSSDDDALMHAYPPKAASHCPQDQANRPGGLLIPESTPQFPGDSRRQEHRILRESLTGTAVITLQPRPPKDSFSSHFLGRNDDRDGGCHEETWDPELGWLVGSPIPATTYNAANICDGALAPCFWNSDPFFPTAPLDEVVDRRGRHHQRGYGADACCSDS
jgi:hypothetical protein